MKITIYSSRVLIAFLLKLSLIFIIALANASGSEKLRINFLSNSDWIEIRHIEHEPEELVILLVRKSGDAIPISIYYQDGPAFPELASIFKQKIAGKQILFVIVKWRYYLSGVNTEGDYYEVHAYEAQKNKIGNIIFQENKKISDFFGSGFDGKQEGKAIKFQFKNATTIRKMLNQNGNIFKDLW